VSDDAGGNFIFNEISPGVYRSDSLSFRGAVGRTYSLHITSADGEKYASDPVTLIGIPEIDSLYYGKDRMTTDDGLQHEGIRIYFDSKKPAEGKYIRWTYEEHWKFSIPFPPYYEYYSSNNIVFIPQKNKTCWKYNNSDDIIIADSDADASDAFVKKPLIFIASDLSDRITVRYFIKVRQYSLSEDEYHFWNLLSQIYEAGGDLFNRQPFQLISNLCNTEKPKDQVLGYFKVSAVREASMYIDIKDLIALNLPRYDYGCSLVTVEPSADYSLDEIYENYTRILGYAFYAPEFDENMRVIGLIFSTQLCADCSKTGNPQQPDFWIDN